MGKDGEAKATLTFHVNTIKLLESAGVKNETPVKINAEAVAIRTALKMYFNPSQDAATRIRGYQGRNINWKEDFSKALHTMKSYKVEFDGTSIRLFDNFIAECKQQNIHLIFVYSPEYIEGQHFVENRKDVMDLYHHYSNKYGIPLYDFSADSMSYNKNYFYNASHLNKTGADLFSSRLASMIKTNVGL